MLAVIFWPLDAIYLAQERWYRRLYDRVREQAGATDFAMNPDAEIRSCDTVATTALGWSTLPLYSVLLALSLLLAWTV